MYYGDVVDALKKVKHKYGQSDPFSLCRDMGIILNFVSLGMDEDAIKGFFIYSHRIGVITINSDLPLVVQRIICAHEIGHAILHKKRVACAFHDVGLYDESIECEKEANFFSAEYLLEDEDVFDILLQDITFFSAAAILKVPVELLDFKFRVMKWKGYKLIEPPIHANSRFLRDMEIPHDSDYYD